MWPGVVGAEDDDQTQLEKKYMKDFIEKKSSHPRYKSINACSKNYFLLQALMDL
jgi:hypothetical protein